MRAGVHKPTYRSWQMMKNRCGNPSAQDFKYYGGVGITYPAKWATYEGFLDDMKERPEGLTLERKDSKKPYSLKNCTWAGRQQQSRNRPYTLSLTYRGVTKKSWEWADALNLKLASFHMRLWKWRKGEITADVMFAPNGRKI